MKIGPVGAELLHTNGRTVRYDEANSRAIMRTRLKILQLMYRKLVAVWPYNIEDTKIHSVGRTWNLCMLKPSGTWS